MRMALSILTLCLLLLACTDRDAAPPPPLAPLLPIASDAELNGRLPGTWIFERDLRVIHFRSVTTVASNGSYVSQITVTKSNSTPDTLSLQGTWQVKDGFLVDTITNDSDKTVRLPYTKSERILRADERELVVDTPSKVFRREAR